mmetsp:Transcript_34577/g.79033  ORF Transcript_34577/g.79033 Transcript_34577/m.79033 type:complete len:266 (-) Transcript_34577:189-986(-)
MLLPATTLKRPSNTSSVHRTLNRWKESASWLNKSIPGNSSRSTPSTGEWMVKARCATVQTAHLNLSSATSSSRAFWLHSLFRKRVFSSTDGNCNMLISSSLKKSGMVAISAEPTAGNMSKYGAFSSSVPSSSLSKPWATTAGSWFRLLGSITSSTAVIGNSMMDSPSAISRVAIKPRTSSPLPMSKRDNRTLSSLPPRSVLQARKRAQASSSEASFAALRTNTLAPGRCHLRCCFCRRANRAARAPNAATAAAPRAAAMPLLTCS